MCLQSFNFMFKINFLFIKIEMLKMGAAVGFCQAWKTVIIR